MPVGLGPQRRSDNEAGGRVPVGFGPQQGAVVRAPVGFQESSKNELGHAGGLWLGGGGKEVTATCAGGMCV